MIARVEPSYSARPRAAELTCKKWTFYTNQAIRLGTLGYLFILPRLGVLTSLSNFTKKRHYRSSCVGRGIPPCRLFYSDTEIPKRTIAIVFAPLGHLCVLARSGLLTRWINFTKKRHCWDWCDGRRCSSRPFFYVLHLTSAITLPSRPQRPLFGGFFVPGFWAVPPLENQDVYYDQSDDLGSSIACACRFD